MTKTQSIANPLLAAVRLARLKRHLTSSPAPLGLDDWERYKAMPAAAKHESNAPTGDIVVPVHGNPQDTAKLLASLDAIRQFVGGQLILVDDANADIAIVAMLEDFTANGTDTTLLRNEKRLGFGASVNRGAELCRNDFLVLNTDIRIAPEAAARLLRHLQRDTNAASVTPLTSNGFLAAFPDPAGDNSALFDMDEEKIDRVFAVCHNGRSIEIPACVAFAVALRKEAFEKAGGFDESAIGYGEDTALSFAFSQLGWSNCLALDTFVPHRGGGSYGKARRRLIREAQKRVVLENPDFVDAIGAFLRDRTRRCIMIDAATALARHFSTRDMFRVSVSNEGLLFEFGKTHHLFRMREHLTKRLVIAPKS